LFAAAWAGRALAARGIDAALGLVATGRATQAPIWLLPLRDILSIGIILASYLSDKVEWRGQMMHTRSTEPPTADLSREPTTVSSPQGTVLS
jgi:hypothetical protein